MPEPIETASYEVSDPYFGQPYIDVDEQRDAPYPHRHVHSRFADCDARFTFYFPDGSEWRGRMYMPLEGRTRATRTHSAARWASSSAGSR